MKTGTKAGTPKDGCCEAPRKAAGERIFDVARDLFYKRGIRAVGVDEIVGQAGVTKPSLYRSYESKDALVAACLESYRDDKDHQVDAVVAAAGDDPRNQLRAVIQLYAADMMAPDFRGCPMSNTAVEFPEAHPARAVLEECKVEFRDRLVGITRQMSVREPEALADGILMLIEGAYSTHHIFGSQGPCQALVRAADALIEAYTPVRTA
ncbi:AcrR family transcriptional regulator [Sphingomonas zeicaulis]|uniref:TetR/AcrR family transcriptional regulator n=1 Tax=Sphingomonas zeicaulis TaxID=1632740 RepID=UPI003D226629